MDAASGTVFLGPRLREDDGFRVLNLLCGTPLSDSFGQTVAVADGAIQLSNIVRKSRFLDCQDMRV